MNEKIFRKQALKKINSPEDLNDVICVTNASVWLVLFAIIILLVGAVCWGIFGQVETTEEVKVSVNEQAAYFCMDINEIVNIHEGMLIRFDNTTGEVIKIRIDEEKNSADVYVDVELPVGIHTGKIVLESIHPISFMTN